MSAWFTTATSANLISTTAVHTQWQYAGIIWAPVRQKRTVTTITNRYVGIDVASAPSLVTTLGATPPGGYATVGECRMTDPEGGGCDVIQVAMNDDGWVTEP